MTLRLMALALLIAGPAWGRGTDQTLNTLRTPNSGMPALVTAGTTFEVDTAAKGEVQLIAADGTARVLTVEWSDLPGGRFLGTCAVAAGTPVGAYALDIAGDRNERSVYVFESFPEDYAMVHITDTHVGREGADETFRKTIAQINEIKPSLVLITGDLTDGGAPEQFQLFLDILKDCAAPTFVCAGNHDRKELNYERFFGPDAYMFRFGPDGYVLFDTKDAVIASELGAQDGDLYRFRRAIRACRWSIGATHRYDPSMGMRSQLTLFVDDPLDILFAGHEHRALEAKVPWGKTELVLTPAAKDGAVRVVLVSDKGIAANAGGLPAEGKP